MKNGKAVNKKRGRAVTVSGISISATTTAQNATSGHARRTFHVQKAMPMRASTVSAVSAFVGDDNGCSRKSSVFVTAVAPKLVPSAHASRWTRNQAPR